MKRRMENKNFVSENICTSAPKHFAKHIFSGLAIISHNDIFLNWLMYYLTECSNYEPLFVQYFN